MPETVASVSIAGHASRGPLTPPGTSDTRGVAWRGGASHRTPGKGRFMKTCWREYKEDSENKTLLQRESWRVSKGEKTILEEIQSTIMKPHARNQLNRGTSSLSHNKIKDHSKISSTQLRKTHNYNFSSYIHLGRYKKHDQQCTTRWEKTKQRSSRRRARYYTYIRREKGSKRPWGEHDGNCRMSSSSLPPHTNISVIYKHNIIFSPTELTIATTRGGGRVRALHSSITIGKKVHNLEKESRQMTAGFSFLPWVILPHSIFPYTDSH